MYPDDQNRDLTYLEDPGHRQPMMPSTLLLMEFAASVHEDLDLIEPARATQLLLSFVPDRPDLLEGLSQSVEVSLDVCFGPASPRLPFVQQSPPDKAGYLVELVGLVITTSIAAELKDGPGIDISGSIL